MKAMVLAAGLGTRLRALTNDRPKALVKVGGRTMLDIALSRLRAFGICDVVINAHHFADMLSEYLHSNHNFGMNIELSREDVLLDTGGGLKNAAHFFGDSSEPFLVRNVDILSNVDFSAMAQSHAERDALATLAVQDRPSLRQLLFDGNAQLCGRRIKGAAVDEVVRPPGQTRPLAFSGIHVISPRIFALLKEEGAFSIVDSYLRLAREGEKIVAFPADEYYWRDLGTLQSLHAAEIDLQRGLIAI